MEDTADFRQGVEMNLFRGEGTLWVEVCKVV